MTESAKQFEHCCLICFAPINESPPLAFSCVIEGTNFNVVILNALQEVFPRFVKLIEKGECLPKNICYPCVNSLKIAYEFHKTCESSNNIILDILKEHDNFKIGDIRTTKHFKYNITKCAPFNKLLTKDQKVDSSGPDNEEQVEKYESDTKENFSDLLNANDTTLEYSDLINIDNQLTDIVKIPLQISDEILNDKFICKNCPKTFKSLASFIYHNKTHNKKYQCELCNKSFAAEHNLKVHKFRHKSIAHFPHLCSECGKIFPTSTELIRHKRTHTNIKLYKCDTCSKTFSQSFNLKIHKMRHTGNRPNVCDLCAKAFTTLSNLNEHKLTHKTEKPYRCTACTKTWATPSDLKKHLRTHNGEKPYRCQYCDKNFARKETLKVHERTHTGEKPYSCTKCELKFVHLSSLNRHIKSHCDDL